MSLALSEHLPLIASAPEGIQKLRGLILELAVRGKLLPQDPKDEPASELLKRIRQERSQLDGAKSRKKIEPPLHAKESPLFELPSSWTWVPFGEIALHNSGKTLDKGRNAGQARDYITTSNLYWGRFELSELKRMLISDDELERCIARKYDLLICEGGEAGRAAVWSFDREVCFQNHVHRARFMGNIDPYFGFRFFEWLNASGEIEHYRKGVGISNMSGKALASIPFTLPPLAEQHRIVAKVDELMALCDRLESKQNDSANAHTQIVETLLGTLTQSNDTSEFEANWKRIAEHFDTLFTTEASVDALQKTILQLAVMGKLVQQDPNGNPAASLIQRISAERSRLEATGTLRASKLESLRIKNNQPVPTGWELTTFGLLTFNRDGERIPVSKDDRNRREKIFDYYGASGIIDKIDGYLFDKPLLLIGEDGANLINRSTPIAFIARGKYWVNNHAHVIDAISEELLEYLELYINSIDLKPYVTGTAQPKMNQAKMNSIPVLLPPEAEQRRIVAKVNELMAVCDQLKSSINAATASQSILSSALIQKALEAA